MKKNIILFILLLLSGCATMGGMGNNEAAIKKLFRYSGTAENVSTNFFTSTQKVIENKKSFSFDEPRVTWWGQVWDQAVLPLKLHIRWIDPQGKLYKEYDFFAMGNLNGIAFVSLPIKNHISSEQSGLWRAIVSFRGIEISSEEFYIGQMAKTNQKLTIEELKKIFQDFDKADALVLLKETKVEVNKNYRTKTIIKRRIKIISDRGEKLYSVINIPFYSALETINANMAHTIKANGEIVEAKEIQMFSPFEDYPSYRAARILSIAMPSVEKGSIIEYEIETDSLMNQSLPSFWDEVYFNQSNPVLISRYVVVCPDALVLKISEFKTNCSPKITVDEAEKTKTYTWEENNLQAVQSEKYMPSHREVFSYINVHTSSSWQDVAVWWNQLSKDKIIINSEIADKAKELVKNSSEELDKIKQIFNFVQSEIRYVQVPFGASPYQPVPAIETFKNRYGDCKDQATLLIAMLKSIGIEEVSYAIVRTKDEGPINETAANPREFNHVIAVVKNNDKEIFLDPTAKNLRFGLIPFSLQGIDALVVRGNEGAFVTIPVSKAESNQIDSSVDLNIHEDLQIDGKIDIKYSGQDEWFARNYLEKLQPKQRDEYVNSILMMLYPGAKIKEYLIQYEKDIDKHLELKIDFSLSNWMEKVDDAYLLKFTDDKIATPPEYLSVDRKFAIEADYAGITKAKINILLPCNVIVNNLPQNFSVESEYLTSSIEYIKEGNKITREQLIESFGRDIVIQDISRYRDVWDEVFKAHKQGIVLRVSSKGDRV